MAGWRVSAVAVALFMATPAQAADDLGSGRRVQGTASVSAVPVGDVDGHVMGVVRFTGLTFFANGTIAPHENVATFDLTHGNGTHEGYVVHRFADGAISVERYRGTVVVGERADRSIVAGTFECTGGTGRFAGLEGGGSYRGERFGGLAAGDHVYVDFTGSCTVP
jgi:hypothetical protein